MKLPFRPSTCGLLLVILALMAALYTMATDRAKIREDAKSVINMNLSLKSEVSGMTKSLSEKDREIERLSSLMCHSRDQSKDSGSAPPRRTASR